MENLAFGLMQFVLAELLTLRIKNSKDTKSFEKRYTDKVPLKRFARTDEVASAVIFLSSEASSYITGSLLTVDGGWTAI